MEFIELTPPLFTDGRKKIQIFNTTGEWSARPIVELKNLSESISIDREAPQWLNLAGIPDMWARPLLFEEALFDENHILHKRVRGEWRGLLALLALKEVYNCSVTAQEVLIDESNIFSAALYKLKPKKFFYTGTDWSRIFVLYYQGKPIGMTSPTSLVCTAAQYEIVGAQITWTDHAQLADPLEKLNTKTRSYVANWIGEISSRLRNDPNAQKSELLSSLLKALNYFSSDLGGIYGSAILSNKSLGIDGLYRYIDKAIQNDDRELESAVQLVSTRNLNQSPTLLIIDPEIAKQWEMPAHQVVVCNSGVLEQLPVSGISDETTFNGIPLPQDVRTKAPSAFFASKLHVITAKEALPGALRLNGANTLQTEGADVTPILPIKQELLNYLEPDNLSKLVFFEQAGNDIAVNLELPLTGPDGEGRIFRVRKVYRKDSGEIVTVENNPVVSIWPNFTRPDWRIYYSYFSTERQTRSFYAEPFAPGLAPDSDHRRVLEQSGEEISREIVQLESFPEAMVCTAKGDEIGLLLLSKPQAIDRSIQNNWTVGVDFGTTGTNVYYRSDSTRPSPIGFASRYHHITATGSAIKSLYEYFLPGEPQGFPISSIFMRTQTGVPRFVYQPLLDGKVFYLKGAHDVFGHNRNNINYNFKWGGVNSELDRKATNAFLKQICLQTLAEAAIDKVDKISWRYSYPTSFSYGYRNTFGQMWSKIIDDVKRDTGIQLSKPLNKATESIAAAKYFNKDKDYQGHFATGAICIDIGGGTSDLSIWQKNMLVYQTSLRLAGRDIFLDQLKAVPHIFQLMHMSGVDTEQLAGLNDSQTYAALDAIVKQMMQDEIYKNLNQIADVEVFRQFISPIALGICGILFYAGLMLKQLIQTAKYDATDYLPDIYLAGNGSKLLHWVAMGEYQPSLEVSGFLKEVFLRAAELPEERGESFNVVVSGQPKAEAAAGLVYDAYLESDQSWDKDICLAGENFQCHKKTFPWNAVLDSEMLASGVKPQGLEVFNAFIEVFNDFAENIEILKVDNSQETQQRLLRKLHEQYLEFTHKPQEHISVDPIFVVLLKSLLENLRK